MLHNSSLSSHSTLRHSIRRQRRALSARQLRSAQQSILNSARQCRQLWQAQTVFSYAPFEGEISPQSLLNALTPRQICLPRITHYRHCRMQFYSVKRLNTHNHFGIIEPTPTSPPTPMNAAQLVLVPLVAFDRNGNRMGMGAGYYDRALQALAHQTGTRPLLVGLAHAFQETTSLQAKPWDVPLDAILTDQECIPISPNLISPNL